MCVCLVCVCKLSLLYGNESPYLILSSVDVMTSVYRERKTQTRITKYKKAKCCVEPKNIPRGNVVCEGSPVVFAYIAN